MEKVNKTELKNFAIQSRRQLIDQVKTKALMYGIDEKDDLEIQEQFGQLMINDRPYPLYMKSAFNSLKNQLKQKGYKQLVEEVAYTWFNRIIAIRYMEVHDYLPEKVNVLSSSVGRVDPDILFEYETMDLPVKQEEIRELLHAGDTEGAFRKLFIAQCNALNSILPFLFEQIQDYTELLLPDFLLDAESVIKVLVQNDELTNSFEEIEVIGWLYQFYNSEPKDLVFANLKKNKKIEKYDIPAATQLFTPKWIVQYMVENSLGQLWLESNPNSSLKDKMKYYIEPAEQEKETQQRLQEIRYRNINLEEITIIDPCVGSGHMLVYAFDLLYEMYEEAGYPIRDIPMLILEKNLFGLDIDDRAAQLATFALLMKGRQKSRTFFRKKINFNIGAVQESNWLTREMIETIAGNDLEIQSMLNEIANTFQNAKEYGSLLCPKPYDYSLLYQHLEQYKMRETDLFELYEKEIVEKNLPNLLKQALILSKQYDVVITNPPYMGSRGFEKGLSMYLSKNYPNSKIDLYSVFIERNTKFVKINGFSSMITMHSWMFLTSFEQMRKKLIDEYTLHSILHLGMEAFEDIIGKVVSTVAFIIRNSPAFTYKFKAIRLVDFYDSRRYEKENQFFNRSNHYECKQIEFNKISSRPIAYWTINIIGEVFSKNPMLENFITITGSQHITANNEKFLRFFWEVSEKDLFEKWISYAKGGSFRKWYGNNELVLDWSKESQNFYATNPTSNKLKDEYLFRKGITWTATTNLAFSCRELIDKGAFDKKGPSLFIEKQNLFYYFMGFLNSSTVNYFLNMFSGTNDYQNIDIKRLPVILPNEETIKVVDELTRQNLEISNIDWDSFETSWDFKKHPLINNISTSKLALIFEQWKQFTESQFNQLKINEEKLNQIFINIYGLQNELKSEVEGKDVTIRKADLDRDVRSFLSYFIGCVVGRYSLDVEKLAFAGGYWDKLKYSSFIPNKYGLVQFTESAYFENDINLRLREFLAVVFSPDTVDENMQWLAEALEMKKGEGADARLRRYFLEEFFVDHCKMYQKRPIYWLVDSGKHKGLRTLIYMHRYQPDTMATIRFEHLQEIQAKYQNEINDLENRLVNPNLSASEKKKLTAEKTSFEKKMDELREFDKRLAEIANEEIEINLDDGVKVNYEKFYRGGKGVLAKIK